MEILKIRVLRGPNYWSNRRKKLIVIDLDIKEFEEKPSHVIPGFNQKLISLIPSLHEHYCSENHVGGFLERLKDGTWLGHVVEHIALELQCLAGSSCGFGRTRMSNQKGIYYVVFAYEVEEAGIYAGKTAVNIVKTLANGLHYLDLSKDLKTLKKIIKQQAHGPSTLAIIHELNNRNIPYTVLDNALMMLGYGKAQKLMCATLSDQTKVIGVEIAGDKALTKKLLASEYIPVPPGIPLHDCADIEEAIQKIGFPLVIKPLDANHGKGVTTKIVTREEALAAFQLAEKYSKRIIAEKYISGNDYRILLVNYKVVAVAKRLPAYIVGDGQSTIQELIDILNQHPHRGDEHENFLTKVIVDDATLSILKKNNLSLDSILKKDRILPIKAAANLSSGGIAEDVTQLIHPANIQLAERVSRLVHLDICGLDVIAESIATPITQETGSVIEVNAAPGLRMHLLPSIGKSRNVSKPIVDMVFPKDQTGRIPIVAVTGTNGKTTTVQLIAHMAKMMGHSVGFTTTEGIYINDVEMMHGDCSGPQSAARVLRDPIVDFAVLECARGGILRAGLGFDHCSVGIVTNISEDHLGMDGIDTLEDMARVKSVVPQSTLKEGFAILNADDPLVLEMKNDLTCNIALFSMQENNIHIIEHTRRQGLVAYIENNEFVVRHGRYFYSFGNITTYPATFFGKSNSMIKNFLPAILTGVVNHFNEEQIIQSLLNFRPLDQMPGRMNIFKLPHCEVMIDYAHNAAAFDDLKHFLEQIEATKKIGIIAGTGDRRDIDIVNVGVYAAASFDEIIIRHDQDGRGRTNQQITDLIKLGIQKSQKQPIVHVISDEFEAIEYALSNAPHHAFIYYFPEDVSQSIHYVQQAQQPAKRTTLSIR